MDNDYQYLKIGLKSAEIENSIGRINNIVSFGDDLI